MENKPTIVPAGRYRLQYRGTECTNCKHPLDISDKYCPSCSQANSTKKLTLKDFFDEFFASMISYDSRLLKTLSALMLRPGKITKDYIAGKRICYTNPFRFLLSLTIVYFLMMSLSGDFGKYDDYIQNNNASIPNIDEGVVKINFGSDEAQELAQALDSISGNSGSEKRSILDAMFWKQDSITMANPQGKYNEINEKWALPRFFDKRQFFETLIRRDSIKTFDQILSKYEVADSMENKNAFNAAKGTIRALGQPGSFFNAILSRLPFLIFFFLPVFALFIWLVYIRKKYNYTDHLIFSFHNQSLLFILLIISFFIDSIFNITTDGFFIIIFGIYLFIALKKFYGQGWFKTIVKYTFLNTIFFILAMLSVVILFIGSAFTY
ncbi:DUF3667 domain-containing protein [Costertonia aggregata]|uniref:DUF3667 domain-containing protein n=2 Tax=Costertonia aggregata TaxID=343403 RepID=A0A7H9AUR4_9FLAO|nr:DUF3667 domain-containing protein [Costertonia aggregata]